MKSPEWIDLSWSPAPGQKVRSPASRILIEVVWWLVLTVPVYLSMPLSNAARAGVWDILAVGLGVAAALWLRRRVPVAALLVVVTLASWGFVGVAGSVWQVFLLFTTFILSYLVGRADSSDYPLVIHLGAMSALVLVLVPVLRIGLLDGAALTMLLVFTMVFPWLVGRYRYQRALLFESGWDRARQLESEQRAIAEQARLRERTRIAEDMHDSLGHELSLIALRSAALEVDPELPDRHQNAAGELRRSAAEATERLREIIGLLRDENDSASTVPVDESITDLVSRATESGMAIDYTVTGEPITLTYMADRAAYRTVQECLTNAAKHATGLPVTIRVEVTRTDTTIVVTNPMPSGNQDGGIGGGRGLVGLSERLRLAGGQLTSGDHAGRFRVEARLPHDTDGPEQPNSGESESALLQQVKVTRQARRRLITAFAIPVVLLTLLGLVSVVVYGLVSFYSVLPPETYAQFQIGQSRESVEDRLPFFEMLDPPETSESPPPGDCVYHPSKQEMETWVDVYRLCFADGVLVSKDVITVEERREWFEDRNSR